MPSKVFQAKERVYVFGPRAASGYSSVPNRLVRLLPVFGVQAVVEGAITVRIDHHIDNAAMGIILMPNWNTTAYWTSLPADYALIGFGSQAPVGATVFWEVSDMPLQNVPVDDQSVVITHNRNSTTIPLFVTPNWNTTVFDSTPDRTLNAARFYFGSSAQGVAPQITWRVAE